VEICFLSHWTRATRGNPPAVKRSVEERRVEEKNKAKAASYLSRDAAFAESFIQRRLLNAYSAPDLSPKA
jgi:hypothetical protein